MQVRSIFRGWVIALPVLWSAVVVVMQMVKGGSVAGPGSCAPIAAGVAARTARLG